MFIAVLHIIVKNSSRVNPMETGHVLPEMKLYAQRLRAFTQILISTMGNTLLEGVCIRLT